MPSQYSTHTLRLGFLPLIDAAPLIVASREGLFAARGLQVRLSRELGWASIRDKIVYGELDAAHGLGTLPLSIALGLGTSPAECPATMILNLHGIAITLSSRLRDAGITDAYDLRSYARSLPRGGRLKLAVVFSPSSHLAVLNRWLKNNRIDPSSEVALVTVPPAQMLRNLRAGTIDGFCAGEPWNTLAILERIGWSPAASATVFPNHPEKVLFFSPSFMRHRQEEAIQVTAAILEACQLCDDPAYRPRLAAILAEPRHVNIPAESIKKSLLEPFISDEGEPLQTMHRFYGEEVNSPTPTRTRWFWEACRECLELDETPARIETLLARLYQTDLFDAARNLMSKSVPSAKKRMPKIGHSQVSPRIY